MYGNALGSRLASGNGTDGIRQRLPVVWPGAPHESAIDIEEN